MTVAALNSWLLRLVGKLPQTWIKAIGRAQWKHPLLGALYIRVAQRFRNQDLEIQKGFGRLVSDDPVLVGQVGEISVAVCRLDTIGRAADLPLPDLIKIDVEGRELDVLAGASDTLRRSRPFLVIELHGTNALVTEALTNLGYHAAVLDGEMSIVEAPWYAHVIAAPLERGDWVRAVDSLHASRLTP